MQCKCNAEIVAPIFQLSAEEVDACVWLSPAMVAQIVGDGGSDDSVADATSFPERFSGFVVDDTGATVQAEIDISKLRLRLIQNEQHPAFSRVSTGTK